MADCRAPTRNFVTNENREDFNLFSSHLIYVHINQRIPIFKPQIILENILE